MEIHMTREELLKHHEVLCKQARDLMDKKNRDYAGNDGKEPFANFTRVEAMGICSTEQGFMVRLTDKMSRLSSIIASGKTSVTNETFEDTMVDVINYIVLLSAYRQEKQLLKQYGDSLFNCTTRELS
jgi:hypothetical protein